MTLSRRRLLKTVLLLTALVGSPLLGGGEQQPDQQAPSPRVTEVPEALRESLKLDPFYKKYTDAKGLPVLSSEKVSDPALLEAVYLINQMLADREDIRKALIKNRV